MCFLSLPRPGSAPKKRAKHLFMRRDLIDSKPELATIDVTGLMKRMKSELDATYMTLERYSGVAFNTLQGWAAGERATQIQALFRLLARVPVQTRHRIIDAACPCFPSLEHPYIVRNRQIAAALADLLPQTAGVTFVLSESDYLRSFVASALVHSFAAQTPNRIVVSGFDIHSPNWFVPVCGVIYLNVWKRLDSLEAAFRGHRLQTAPLILLNGLYSSLQSVRSEAQQLSATSHIIIADGNGTVRDPAQFSPPAHVIKVATDRRYSESVDDAAYMAIDIREAE